MNDMPEENTLDEAAKNTEAKKGNQKPTLTRTIEYQNTLGEYCINLYEQTGRKALEWQELLIYDILAINDDYLFTHTKFGFSVPRRNGKSEILKMRAIFGIIQGEEKILWTAHRTTTSHSSWEGICELLGKLGFAEGKDYKTTKQFGLERIQMLNRDGYINFRTRSTKGGLGEGYDLLIIDEAQEYTIDQESAIKYVVTDSKNPQTILCGTPPTVTSSGTVFTKFRQNVLSGDSLNSGWSEWSVDSIVNTKDKTFWYSSNPSLGTIFTERSVMDEVGQDDLDFNIQRLGLWIKYNQKSAITKTEWDNLRAVPMPKIIGKISVGVKFSVDGGSVSLSVAVKTKEDKTYIEAIDCRPVRDGYDWIINFIKKSDVDRIAIDGASGQKILADRLKEEKIKSILPTVREIITASATFENAIYSDDICHGDQPSLSQIITNCDKRPIGTAGGFGYKSLLEGADVTLLDSVILAHWLCATQKEHKMQRVNY